jgi:hypothetical protein
VNAVLIALAYPACPHPPFHSFNYEASDSFNTLSWHCALRSASKPLPGLLLPCADRFLPLLAADVSYELQPPGLTSLFLIEFRECLSAFASCPRRTAY